MYISTGRYIFLSGRRHLENEMYISSEIYIYFNRADVYLYLYEHISS